MAFAAARPGRMNRKGVTFIKLKVQYIPLDRIQPGPPPRWTERMKTLRQNVWDVSNLLVVKWNKSGGNYTVLIGNERLEQFRKYTKRTHAPCLIDGRGSPSKLADWLSRMRKPKLPYPVPKLTRERVEPAAWSIIRSYMKQDPRFRRLTRSQQLKVLMLGIRYKRTAIASMKAKTNGLLNR